MKNKIANIFKGLSLIKFLLLTLAGIINAIGITIFLSPVKLYDSGISGTSMLLAQITPEYLTLSIFLVIINIPLFLYGLKKQGAIFTIYAIYSVLIYSLTAWLITDILPIDVNLASPLAGTDLLLCALFGGVISGIGSGLAIRFGGAMDGIEAMGGYSNIKKTMVYFVVNRFQVAKLKDLVHSIDPKAYISITEVADVFSANQNK